MNERRPGYWYVGWGLTEELRWHRATDEHEFRARADAQRFLQRELSWFAGGDAEVGFRDQALTAAQALHEEPEIPHLGDSTYQVGPYSYYIQLGKQPVELQKAG